MRISDWSSDVCSSDLGIFLVKQAFYCLFDIYLINTCQKAQPSQINTQHRQSRIPDQSYRIKQSPVTSQAQQKLRITRQILMRIKRCALVRPVNLLIAKKRSEERRVGQACDSTCRSRWSTNN